MSVGVSVIVSLVRVRVSNRWTKHYYYYRNTLDILFFLMSACRYRSGESVSECEVKWNQTRLHMQTTNDTHTPTHTSHPHTLVHNLPGI